ncbi:MAG: Rieske (2Fe-2S) protein [Gammaproteobacteria bacterium]
MNKAAPGQVLCRAEELAKQETRGFAAVGVPPRDVFVVLRGESVHAYINSCPHTGAPLDWLPNLFLSADGQLIQCALHGALFRIEDGVCVAGPCAGARLKRQAIEVRHGVVVLLDDSLA